MRRKTNALKHVKEIVAFILASFIACTVYAAENRAEPQSSVPGGAEKRNHVLPPLHTERYEYYEVCGCCEEDLQCEMTAKAITWKDGNQYDAITRWRVKWDYDYRRDEHSCLTDSFRVDIEIIFQFPKWVCEGDAPSHLTQKWERYIRNLVLHEKGHRDRALRAAEEFTRAVAEMPPATSCSELDRNVRRLCNARMSQLDEEQQEYDAETGHGHVEGVSFP